MNHLYPNTVSLARDNHCFPQFFFILLPYQRLYIVKNVCVYIHSPDCTETVYELPLLSNNTACETFLDKSGGARSVDWIFIIGAPVWQ